MSGQGARHRRRERRAQRIGPERYVLFVDILFREETLECGHVYIPYSQTGIVSPFTRRCIECLNEKEI